MPFVIPIKRGPHGFNVKMMSDYRSIEKSQFFSLQQKKTPVLGFGNVFSGGIDRPGFRIITRNLGGHIYDVAYSDDLNDIKTNEWKYCNEELHKIMPRFEDIKTQRKWMMAHFTTLAIRLGCTADNRYVEMKNGYKTGRKDTIVKSDTDLATGRNDLHRSSNALWRMRNDRKSSLALQQARSDHPPEEINRPPPSPIMQFPDEIEAREKLEESPTENPVHTPSGPLRNIRPTRHARNSQMSVHQMKSRSRSLPASSGGESFLVNTDDFKGVRYYPKNLQAAEEPLIIIPVKGVTTFVVMSFFMLLLISVARDCSRVTLILLSLFILAINYSVAITNSPFKVVIHVDVRQIFQLRRVHQSARRRPAAIRSSSSRSNHFRRHSNATMSMRENKIVHSGDSIDESEEDDLVHLNLAVLQRDDSENVVDLSLNVVGQPMKEAKEGKEAIEGTNALDSKEEKKKPQSRRASTDSMIDVSKMVSSGKFYAGVSTANRTKRKWEPIEAKSFRLRCGPNYRRNGLKKPSVGSFYDIVAVDTFKSHTKENLSDIGNKVDLSELTKENGGWFMGVPRIWIVVLQIPAYAPSVMGGTLDGQGYAVCFYFRLNADGEEAIKKGQGAAKVMQKFLSEPLTIADADRGPHQWKNMVRLENSADLQLGWVLNSYVAKYNAKPFLSRNCKSYYKGPDHFEVDVDIHRFNYISRQGMYQLRSYLKQLTLDIGFVVQCDADDELPEKLLGCVRLKGLDAEKDAIEFDGKM